MKKQLLSLVFTLSILSLLYGQELNYSNLDNNLIDAIEKGGSSEFDIYIILEDKVDLSALDQSLRGQNLDRTERAKIVMASLSQKAKQSQGNLISELQRDNGVEKESIQSYWLANIVFMKANKKAIAKLSNDPRVEFIGIDGQLQLVESEDEYTAMAAPDGVESGLERINVRPLWNLGYTGYGRLALVADTGIDPTHRSFGHRYRGNTNGDNEGWYAYNNQEASPFQCGDHGTHVLGTVLGLDRLNRDTIGVAFDAQWLGSANLCGGGTQSNIGTFQWSVNPDDDLDTVDDMADVINNSWWDPSVFGEDCNSVYVDVLEALEVMGVVVVFSGGNAGPDPATMTSPHNINIDIVNTFTVAALNGNNNQLEVADFSSRGPSTCGGEGSLLIKPEVSAPGVTVRSAVLENEYGFKSGTSMAAPHVAGAVLILRQAFPEIGSRELKLALYNTCADLGEPGEDNVYGMGIIDVFAAYNYLIAEGYEPAPPVAMENDLMAYDLITDRFECNETLTSEFVFFNNTIDTLRSMDIIMTIDGNADQSISIPWEGEVAPFMLDTIMLDAIDFETGTHEVALEIMNPNGNVDERSLNNKILKTILISSNERLETFSLEEQVTCRNADILIKADYEGDGTIQWFDEATGGNLIAEGTQIAIAASSPRTIYGDILRTSNNGKESSDAVIFNTFNDQETGIEFNALFPFRITAFDFYSEQVGNIFLGVENGRRDQIESEIFKSDGSGWQTAEVSIRIPEGFGYRLLYKDGAAELGVSNTDLDYPYVVDNVMNITGGTNGNRYNYFYNLRVEYLDLCGRVPVDISTVPTDSLPVASFEINVDFVDIANNQEIQFFSSAENAVSFEWDFGDGSTSNEENPIHTYTEGGIYYPSLLVYNAEGCSDAFVGRVEIFDATTSVFNTLREVKDFEIAPNPFSQKLNFKTDLPVQVEYVEIYNSAGLLTKTFQVNNRISFHTEQIEELVSGLYYVLIHTKNGVESHKVIKH